MDKRLMNSAWLFLQRHQMALLLGGMSLFCAVMSFVRFFATGSGLFLFLNWNLFLAFIPWLASSIVAKRDRGNRALLVMLIFVWILFFPNAPYIITDFVHLRISYAAPAWFDILLILSFAWTGLVFGFLSLMNIEKLLRKYVSYYASKFFIIAFIFIASFGVYLGRYLRWNSWDIVSDPLRLLSDIFSRVINPFMHARTWGMTIFFGIVLNMIYFSIQAMAKQNDKVER